MTAPLTDDCWACEDWADFLRPPDDEVLGASSQALEAGRNRIVLAAAAFLAVFVIFSLRLVDLATADQEIRAFAAAQAEPNQSRADIVDRRGMLLATDVAVFGAYADPARIWDAAETAQKLKTVLPDLDAASLTRRLKSKSRFVWIRRKLTPQQKFAIHNLGLPGIGFRPERKRFYPHGDMIAHVLGYTDIDGQGIAGIEKSMNPLLEGRTHSDEPVAISIDLRVQHSLFHELQTAMTRFKAEGAAGVVLDAHTGEVLALASLPSFNPHAVTKAAEPALFNRATSGVYELGSTLKAFTVAMALDTQTAGVTDSYDATHPILVGGHRIRDYHAKGRPLTVAEILRYSSNIGAAKMAEAVGTLRQRAYLEKFGLLDRLDFELPEVAAPLLPARWGPVETMTISYGHGLALSPLQLASGAAALVNGGCRYQVTILKIARDRQLPCDRVISEDTSHAMRALLRAVVKDGSGRRADVEGYPVAGKTGTAEKASSGGYNRRALISSFLGVFPAPDPRYVVLVVLDEPKPTAEFNRRPTGGWTAAPVVGDIVRRIAPMTVMRPVAPSRPVPERERYIAAGYDMRNP